MDPEPLDPQPEDLLASVPVSRRAFVRRLAAGAFALPIVGTFAVAASASSPYGRGGNPYPTGWQCRNGGWYALGFENEGDCVAYFATEGKNPYGLGPPR